MLEQVQNISDPLVIALVGAGATVLSALVGFSAIIFQIGRQGRHAIEANKQNEALKRKVEIYELTLATSRQASQATTDLAFYLRRLEWDLDLWQVMTEGNLHWRPPEARFSEYRRLSSEASQSVVKVMTMIESWHIVGPKLDIFRYAFAMGLEGLRDVSASADDILIISMPIEGREGEWTPPDDTRRDRLKIRIEAEAYQADRLSAWIHDFQVEMQILLLSDLFPNPVERREPPDPNMFCIRLDRYEEIKDRIDSSEWGKKRVEWEAKAWQTFSSEP